MNETTLQQFSLQSLEAQVSRSCIKSPRNPWEVPKIFVDLNSTAKFISDFYNDPIWVNCRLARLKLHRRGRAGGRGSVVPRQFKDKHADIIFIAKVRRGVCKCGARAARSNRRPDGRGMVHARAGRAAAGGVAATCAGHVRRGRRWHCGLGRLHRHRAVA